MIRRFLSILIHFPLIKLGNVSRAREWGIVLTQRAGPGFRLLVGGKERAGAGGHSEGQVPAEGHLGEKKIHGVSSFQAEGPEDLFGGLEVTSIDAGSQKSGCLHSTNMLKSV